MSLYIGNLSSRTRRNELELVFQRFGQCDVRLKDGYGFVVYKYPPNAEKALSALQEKYICGEPLTLTWSNKQPRPFRRSGRAVGSYERRCVRGSARWGEYKRKELDMNDRKDLGEIIAKRDRDGGELSSDEMLDVGAARHEDDMQEYIVEGRLDHREDLNGGGGVEPNPIDDDRWGVQFHDPPNENYMENEVEFDRYEPFQDYGGKYDDEEISVKPSSRESTGRDHIGEYSMKRSNDAKSKDVCYKCGAPGHKMRNCRQGNHSQRKFSRSHRRHDQDNMRRGTEREELGRLEFKPGEKLRSSRNSGPVSRHMSDVKSPNYLQHWRSRRDKSSSVINEAHNSGRKDYGGNKRSRKAIDAAKNYSRKKAKRSASSPLRSDDTASRSHSTSHSSKHVRGYRSRFRSRSVSSGMPSVSSDSKSSSATKNLRSKGSKSRTRTKSSSPTSLSVSIGQPLSSSPKEAQKNHRNEVLTSELKEVLIEKGQMMQADVHLEGAKTKHAFVATDNDTATSSKSGELEKDQILLKNNNFEIVQGPLDVTQKSTQLVDETTLISGSLSEERLTGAKDYQNSDALMTKHVSLPANNDKLQAHDGSYACHSTKISPQELSMVLEHYRLGLYDESERPLLPEAYFGSARLWPWEVIYYRRLKKGPISLENYARRVDQNKEFGIVDKYIRSSSGWGELGQAKL